MEHGSALVIVSKLSITYVVPSLLYVYLKENGDRKVNAMKIAKLLGLLVFVCLWSTDVSAGDLEILNLEGPKQALPGEKIGRTVNVNVKNKSTKEIYEDVIVNILLSRDKRVKQHPPIFSQYFREDGILSGGRGNLWLVQKNNRWCKLANVVIPATTKPGKYYLVAVAYTLDRRKRGTAGRAISYWPLWVRNPNNPDLVPYIRAPKKTFAGKSLKKGLAVTVKNRGKRAAKNFYVDLVLSRDKEIPYKLAKSRNYFLEDMLLPGGRATVKYLGPGKSTRIYFPGSLTVPGDIKRGNYNLFAYADAGNRVSERDEENNHVFQRVRLIPVHNKPDIVGTIKLNGTTTVRPGEALAKRVVVYVENKGPKPAGKFVVELMMGTDVRFPLGGGKYTPGFSEDCLLHGGRGVVYGLKPGQKRRVSFKGACRVPITKRTGSVVLGAVFDPRGSVSEIKENNNTAVYQVNLR